MGFGELMGVKTIKIMPKEKMTLDELYEKIKDVEFDAGKPELVKHGLTPVIAFPQEDRENQVWIIASKDNFVVQRSVIIAGLKNMVVNNVKADVINDLTGGFSGLKSAFGSPKKLCMAHVDDAATRIKAIVE